MLVYQRVDHDRSFADRKPETASSWGLGVYVHCYLKSISVVDL